MKLVHVDAKKVKSVLVKMKHAIVDVKKKKQNAHVNVAVQKKKKQMKNNSSVFHIK